MGPAPKGRFNRAARTRSHTGRRATGGSERRTTGTRHREGKPRRREGRGTTRRRTTSDKGRAKSSKRKAATKVRLETGCSTELRLFLGFRGGRFPTRLKSD